MKELQNSPPPHLHLHHNSFSSKNVLLNLSETSHILSALIYSGAASNFIDTAVIQKLQKPTQELPQPVSIKAIDGRPTGEGFITTRTQPLELQVRA